MFLIAGLGNPGPKYEATRHNIGFEAIDYIARQYDIKLSKLANKGVYGEGNIQGQKVLLVKPQTFMNLSGQCILAFANYYKIDKEKIIIIYDDVNLDLGRMRIRKSGSDGGHNGMKNIIYLLKTDEFPRIRLGVGLPSHKDYDLADFVLSKFTKDEILTLEQTIKDSLYAVELMVKLNVDAAMNRFNSKN